MPKIRTLFSNEEILKALDKSKSIKQAAKILSDAKNVEVSSQLLTYWKRGLEFTNSKGLPYTTDTKINKKIRESMKIRKSDKYDDKRITDTNENNQRILIIPDMHSPYHHKDTLRFLSDLKERVNPTRVICLGDETDGHGLSFHDSDPNLDSSGPELTKAKRFLRKLAAIFPIMDVCHSNHGSLIYRRSYKFGIPVQYIKSYRNILFDGLEGDGWEWKDKIFAKLPNGDTVLFQHQSSGDILANAAHERANIVQGHEHGKFEIQHRASSSSLYWSMVSGCLVNNNSLAFAYGKLFPKKPIIGAALIIDSIPSLVSMPLTPLGRYKKKLGDGVYAYKKS